MAGYIDGDGCFLFIKESNPIKYRAQIVISSTNKPVLDHFRDHFLGSVYLTPARESHWKRTYHWIIRGKFALELSYEISEFLTEKYGDCLIFMNFIKESNKEIKNNLIIEMNMHRDNVRQIDESIIQELRNIVPTGITNDLDYPYLAGFIDAECSFGISKYKPKDRPNFTYKIILQCNNANPIIFYWLMERLGGGISFVKRRNKNPNHRDQIIWNLSGNNLFNLLLKIHPFLISKKMVCEKLIEFYNTTLPNGGDRQSEDFKKSYESCICIRESLIKDIHNLNSKGVNNV